MFSRLSMFQKMIIAPLMAILIFALYILFVYFEQSVSKKYLLSIQENHFPIMNIAQENNILLDNVIKSFKDSANSRVSSNE